jgi:hypothetical protein
MKKPKEGGGTMQKTKLIGISSAQLKAVKRLLGKLEGLTCLGCAGKYHDDSCPAAEAFRLRNCLTQRLNNPNRYRADD